MPGTKRSRAGENLDLPTYHKGLTAKQKAQIANYKFSHLHPWG